MTIDQQFMFHVNNFGTLNDHKMSAQNLILGYIATNADATFNIVFSIKQLKDLIDASHKMGASWTYSGKTVPEISAQGILNIVSKLDKTGTLSYIGTM